MTGDIGTGLARLDFGMSGVFMRGGESSRVQPLIEAYVGDGRMVNSGEFDGLSVEAGKAAVTAKGWKRWSTRDTDRAEVPSFCKP